MIKNVRVYTCAKHPTWTLESSAPLLGTIGIKQFCPLCRDEFWIKAIGEADCRVEKREVQEGPEKAEPMGGYDLFAEHS